MKTHISLRCQWYSLAFDVCVEKATFLILFLALCSSSSVTVLWFLNSMFQPWTNTGNILGRVNLMIFSAACCVCVYLFHHNNNSSQDLSKKVKQLLQVRTFWGLPTCRPSPARIESFQVCRCTCVVVHLFVVACAQFMLSLAIMQYSKKLYRKMADAAGTQIYIFPSVSAFGEWIEERVIENQN